MNSSKVSQHVAKLEQKAAASGRPPLGQELPPRVARHAPVKEATPLAVYLRIRPSSSKAASTVNTIEIEEPTANKGVATTIRTYPPLDSNAAKVVRDSSSNDAAVRGVKEFQFHQVFGPEETQQDIYNVVASPLVRGLFPAEKSKTIGESALLFAYGITNAGKTYTMMGGKSSSNKWGIIPRAMQDIFAQMEGEPYELRLSYLEIYNEQIFDLLPNENASSNSSFRFRGGSAPLKLRESHGQTFVRGLTKHRVQNVAHGMELADKAKSKRHTSSNNINADSSRSHCICQLEIARRSPVHAAVAAGAQDDASVGSDTVDNGYTTDEEASQVARSSENTVTLWIVDLAGSERSKRTGMASREAALINGSLMKLMRCLSVMRENQASSSAAAMIPYRDSKLTHLFMNHLTGPSANRTSMIVNVNPSAADFDETQHVLSYAAAAKNVQISQGDYLRKRKGMGDDIEPTHDYNGRPLKRANLGKEGAVAATKSSKIAQLVKKFSPKGFSPKKFGAKKNGGGEENRKRKAVVMEKEADKKPVAAVEAKAAPAASNASQQQPKDGEKRHKLSRFGGVRQQAAAAGAISSTDVATKASYEKEIKKLQASLSLAKAEIETLKEQMAQQETSLRLELCNDMEEEMRRRTENFHDIIEKLKAKVQLNPAGPAQSVKKAQQDKADQYVSELLDQVSECEEEMTRMREEHAAEIAKVKAEHEKELSAKDAAMESLEEAKSEEIAGLKEAHADELDAKDKEMENLKEEHQYELAMKAQEIDSLEGELEKARADNEKLEKSKAEMIRSYEQIIREENDDEAEDDAEDEEEEKSEEEEEEHDPTPRKARMSRKRVSEVACDPADAPKSSSKKSGSRRLRTSRVPFGSVLNRSRAENSTEDSSSDSDEGSFGPDKWIQPRKQAEKDEDGLYIRPRGRAPSGSQWDAKVGAWRLSQVS